MAETIRTLHGILMSSGVNTLRLVDDDIRAAFADGTFDNGLPLTAQLSKDIRLLTEAVQALTRIINSDANNGAT